MNDVINACPFYQKSRNRCTAKEIVAEYGLPGHGHRIMRLPNGTKDKYCKTTNHRFCGRKYNLEQIIEHGDYEG